MKEDRPPIPEEIKKRVRQKSKFGCVICGCPVYDFEHLVDYAIVKEHNANNIVCICPNCHRKKTNGEISIEQIQRMLKQIDRDKTKPEKILQEKIDLDIGGNIIESFSGFLFRNQKKDYIELSYSWKWRIDAELYNRDGKLAIKIVNNEYQLFDSIWDIKYEGGKLTFRNEPYDVFLNIKFDGRNSKLILTGKIYIDNNKYIWIKDDGIYYNGNLLAKNSTCKKL